MKFSIDIECSPKEARQFLGLPDVEEFQQRMMDQVQDKLGGHIAAMDPEALMKTWLPLGAQAWEAFQKSFAQGFAKPKE